MAVRKDIWRGPLNLGTEAGTPVGVVKEGNTTQALEPFETTTPRGNTVFVDVDIHHRSDVGSGLKGRVEGRIRFGRPKESDEIVDEKFNLDDGAPPASYTSGGETVTLEHLSSKEETGEVFD